MELKSLKVWTLAFVLALTLVLSTNPALAKGGLHTDFESGPKPFLAGGSGSTGDQELSIATGDDGCGVGKSYANLKFQHEGDSPIAWIVAPVAGNVGGNDLVRIEWSAKNVADCEACIPMYYIGSTEPTSISQFRKAVASPNDPFPYGDWTSYRYPAPGDTEKPVLNKGVVYVALGFAAPSSKVKQISAVGFDCVDIVVFPAP